MGMSYEELEQSLIRTGRNLVEAEKREDDFYQAAREAQQRLEERTTERDYHMRMGDKLAERIREMVPALKEAERFMAYFAGETGGSFVGPGTPQSCLEQIRAAIRAPEGDGRWKCAARKQSLPEPADCDWPVCGCDPYADKVIDALHESGRMTTTDDLSAGQLFNVLLSRINFDGMDPRTFSLAELKNSIDGAEWAASSVPSKEL